MHPTICLTSIQNNKIITTPPLPPHTGLATAVECTLEVPVTAGDLDRREEGRSGTGDLEGIVVREGFSGRAEDVCGGGGGIRCKIYEN